MKEEVSINDKKMRKKVLKMLWIQRVEVVVIALTEDSHLSRRRKREEGFRWKENLNSQEKKKRRPRKRRRLIDCGTVLRRRMRSTLSQSYLMMLWMKHEWGEDLGVSFHMSLALEEKQRGLVVKMREDKIQTQGPHADPTHALKDEMTSREVRPHVRVEFAKSPGSLCFQLHHP
jgi:hypothetical protein